nr:9847_t:CDS:2 [Entrophospora candida]
MKVIKASSDGDNDEGYEKFINSSDFKTTLSCFGGSKSEKVKTTRQKTFEIISNWTKIQSKKLINYLDIMH